jgi:hypothetical protein
MVVGMAETLKSSSSYVDRFVDFDKDRGLFRTFANPCDASYEDAEPTLQLKLIDPHCSGELRSKFKEGDLLNFYKYLPKDK